MPKTLQLLEISRFQFNFHHDFTGDLFNFVRGSAGSDVGADRVYCSLFFIGRNKFRSGPHPGAGHARGVLVRARGRRHARRAPAADRVHGRGTPVGTGGISPIPFSL